MKTNEEQDFPGYPHYPANEDITKQENNNGKVSADANKTEDTIDNPADVTSDADVTPEELDMLRSEGDDMDGEETQAIKNQSLDSRDNDGNLLNEASSPFTGNNEDDLDIPGSENDDADERIGEEDEENNYYSLDENDEEQEDRSRE